MIAYDLFENIVADTIHQEGGYKNDPADPGGETKFGISKRRYPDQDIVNLTIEQAVALYYFDFWSYPGLDQLDDFPLARKLFDLGVNTGPENAIKMLQRAVNTVCAGEVAPQRQAPWRQTVARLLKGKPLLVDGILGPITLEVIKTCPYAQAIRIALKGEAYNHYKKLKPLYIPGWLTRLAS